MNSNRYWSLKLAAWLVGLFLFLLLIVLPLLTSVLINTGRFPPGFSQYLTSVERIQTWAMRVFTIVWLFFVGGCFASFLNVVAWRVPRGKSILGSSRCPRCETDLKFSDNLPVVGWLKNNGRCSECRSPISPRYLIAEIVLGSVFLLLAIFELILGGWNLPFFPIPTSIGIEAMLFDPHWSLVRLLIYHLILLSTLFTFALIEFEDFPVPQSVFVFPLLVGCLMVFIWPELYLISWNTIQAQSQSQDNPLNPMSLVNPLLGGSVGFLIASLLHQCGLDPQLQKFGFSRSGLAAGLMLIGVFLGWQSVFSVAIVFLLISLIGQLLVPASGNCEKKYRSLESFWNNSSRLFLATLIHLLFWRFQVSILAG